MTDLTKTIAPKSDQLNADDLTGIKALTIKITGVKLCVEPQQPVSISFEGDGGRPYKPCKSMRRVLISIWGGDGSKYIGRSLSLYRDERVMFGGQEVGGIRISHMSDILLPVTMALTASKQARKPYTVQPLEPPAHEFDIEELRAAGMVAAKDGKPAFLTWYNGANVKPAHKALKQYMAEFQAAVQATEQAKTDATPAPEPEPQSNQAD